VQGNRFYLSKPGSTAVVNAADMQKLHEFADAVSGTESSSFVPWSTNFMIESNMDPSDPDITSIQYYDAQNNWFDTGLTQFYVGQPLLAMVYNTNTIVLVGWHPNLATGRIATSNWTVDFTESPDRAWIEDDTLVILTIEQYLLKFHMVRTKSLFCAGLTKLQSNGTRLSTQDLNQYQGNNYIGNKWMFSRGKSFTQVIIGEEVRIPIVTCSEITHILRRHFTLISLIKRISPNPINSECRLSQFYPKVARRSHD
jgi:hypothetical protein